MGNLESIAQGTTHLQPSDMQRYMLMRGVRNAAAIENLMDVDIALRNPAIDWYNRFESKRHGLIARYFKVYEPIEAGGKTIDPVATIHEMIAVASHGYEMIQRRLESIAENAYDAGTYNPTHFTSQAVHTLWYREFRRLIQQELSLANDVALWVQALTRRQDIVGKRAPKMLADFGVTDVHALPQDIKTTGEKLLKFYDSYEQHQLKQYQ